MGTVPGKIALKLEYEGTNYNGFQWQVGVPTVQGEVEQAIWKLTGEKLRVIAASRTDTGVHARGQMLSFRSGATLRLEAFVRGLNYHLPRDIAVKAAFRVGEEFSVRRDAVSRQYEYYILNSLTRSPVHRRLYYHVPGILDIEAMSKSCQALVGEHDFASFTTSWDKRLKSTVRRIERAEVYRRQDLVVFSVAASSFLHHQVRNMAGSLIRVGLGRIPASEMSSILEASQPGLGGPRAPACGLYLTKIKYETPFWEEYWGDFE